ncbi:hypothetical protein V2J09_014316 [Rumex salicifolius]
MQSGIIFRSHSSPFHILLQNHPWPSTFHLRLPSLSYPLGTPDSGAGRVRNWNFGSKRYGERIWEEKKRSRRWWSDDGTSELEDLAPGLWEEFLDNLWLLKVFRSYGWMSPIIIISWLAASGPKAFLMAFSIPFGINVLTFVFKKLWGWIQSNTDLKPKSTPKMENVSVMTEEEEDEEEEIQWKSKQTTQIQSDVGENVSSVNSNNGSPSFGGWEDLIDERELKARRAKRRIKAKKKRSVPLEERMRQLKMKVEGVFFDCSTSNI